MRTSAARVLKNIDDRRMLKKFVFIIISKLEQFINSNIHFVYYSFNNLSNLILKLINNIFMRKIILFICFTASLQFSDLIAAELNIIRSGDYVQYLGSQREVKLSVNVSTMNEVFNVGLIGRKKSHSLKIENGLTNLTLIPISNRKDQIESLRGTSKIKEFSSTKKSQYSFTVNDNEIIEIFIFPAKKRKVYESRDNMFSQATGNFQKEDIIFQSNSVGTFDIKAQKKVLMKTNDNLKKEDLKFQLLELKDLFESGLLSKEVYDEEVNKILSKI